MLHLLDFLLDMGILKLSLKLKRLEKMKHELESESEELKDRDSKSGPFNQDFKDANPVEAYMDTTMQ